MPEGTLAMTTQIVLTAAHFDALDLSPVQTLIEAWLQADTILQHEQSLQFQIQYPQDPDDPQEFSQISDIRLWFLALDTLYPWLPLLVDWASGDLVRYAAMLIPHEFSPREGIQFNPQALDIFMMQKLFVITRWLKTHGVESETKVAQMAMMFGYEIDPELFNFV
jgi:hypothetical protein